MELSEGASEARKSIRTTRRLGAWQFREEIEGRLRRIEIAHDSHQMRLRYASDESGAPKLLEIAKPASASDPATAMPVRSDQPLDLNRTEVVLGETCHWFDMMPGMADASALACRTEGGIILKDDYRVRGGGRTWTAVRLTRRPMSLDEIKLPAELFKPETWEIE